MPDLAITPHVPEGFAGEPLTRMRFIAAAHQRMHNKPL